jgi:hypothetical protein
VIPIAHDNTFDRLHGRNFGGDFWGKPLEKGEWRGVAGSLLAQSSVAVDVAVVVVVVAVRCWL